MIDNLLNQLNSRDPEQRKKAIKGLAQTKDRAALKYLAAIVKTESNPEIRDLALKAGRYIQKHAAEETQPEQAQGYGSYAYDEDEAPAAEDRLGSYSSYEESSSPYPEEDEGAKEEAEPLPDQIVVSDADIERAKGFVQSALNWHMKEDNDKAAQYLSRAFRANPKLKYDGYTKGLAATITGMAADEAVRLLSPSAEELRKRVGGSEGVRASGAQRFLALLLLLGSATLLVSFLTFPWVDLSPIPVDGLQGVSTLGDLLAKTKDQLNQAAAAAPTPPTGPAADIMNAFNALKLNTTGLETTLLALGAQDMYDVMGFRNLATVAKQQLPPLPKSTPKPLDYSLLLVPVVAALALLMAFMLLIRRSASITLWVFAILLGLVGMLPFWYFYTDARQNLLSDSANVGTALGSSALANFSGVNVIAFGFWLALGAQVAVLFLPFLALLVHPSPEKAKNE